MDAQVNPGRVTPANCQDLYDRGETKNGLYFIQPSLEVDAFEVTCDFQNDPVLTIIGHDKPGKQMTATPGQQDGCEGMSLT